MSILDKIKNGFKYKWSPSLPSVNFNDKESRQNFILYMASREEGYPSQELKARSEPFVSWMTINKDLLFLEEQKLIRRKRHGVYTTIYGTFKDSGIDKLSNSEIRRDVILKYGLPFIALILLVGLISLSFLL